MHCPQVPTSFRSVSYLLSLRICHYRERRSVHSVCVCVGGWEWEGEVTEGIEIN